MIKINLKGLELKRRQLNKILRSSTGRAIRKQLAKEARDKIYKRVKSGWGVTSDSAQTPSAIRLKALSDSYKLFRAGKIKFFTSKKHGKVYPLTGKFEKPTTGKFAGPRKSNLTLSGQMLDAMDYKITSKGFTIFIKRTSRKGSKLNNKKVAEYASEDRPFLALTESEQRLLSRQYRTLVRSLVQRLTGG